MANEKEKQKYFNAKKMLEANADKGTKVHYGERMEVEITTATQNLKVGTIIKPHKVKALALIEQGFAKEVTKKK